MRELKEDSLIGGIFYRFSGGGKRRGGTGQAELLELFAPFGAFCNLTLLRRNKQNAARIGI